MVIKLEYLNKNQCFCSVGLCTSTVKHISKQERNWIMLKSKYLPTLIIITSLYHFEIHLSLHIPVNQTPIFYLTCNKVSPPLQSLVFQKLFCPDIVIWWKLLSLLYPHVRCLRVMHEMRLLKRSVPVMVDYIVNKCRFGASLETGAELIFASSFSIFQGYITYRKYNVLRTYVITLQTTLIQFSLWRWP